MSFPFKRFFSYLVLVSFFFQTLWPSVVFAADADVLRPISPRSVFSPSFVPQDTSVKAVAPFTLQAFVDDQIEGFDNIQTKPVLRFPGSASLFEAQTWLNESLEAQSLYPGLVITEQGLCWSQYGLGFLMAPTGHLVVTSIPNRQSTTKNLRIHNFHGDVIFGGHLSLSHVQVQAQNILQTSPDSLVERLEVWAMGQVLKDKTIVEGRFRNEEGATLRTQDVTFHEGHLENLGTWTIDDEGVLDLQGHDCINKGTVTLGTNTILKQQGTFGNAGVITGSSYTLEMERGENAHTISGDAVTLKVSETLTNQVKGRLLGQSSLTLSGTGHIENKGTVSSSGSLTLENATFTNQKLLNVDGPFHLAVQNRFTNSGTGSVLALGSTTFTGHASIHNDAPSTDHAGLAFGGEGTFRDFEGQVMNAGLITFQKTVTGNLRKLVNRGTFGVNGAYQNFRIVDFFNDRTGRVLGGGILTLTGINRGLMQADHLLLDIEGSFTHEAGGLLKGLTRIAMGGRGIFHRHGALQTPLFRVETSRFDNAVSLIDDEMDVVIGSKTTHWENPKDVTVAVKTLTLEGPSENEDDEEEKATLDALNEGTLTVGTFINGRAFTNRGSLNLGTWHQSDSVFKNDLGGMIDVSGVTEFDTDTLDNSGDITFEEKVTGRLHQIHNKGGLFFKKNATLRGSNLLNQKILKAGGLFQWEGRTLENGETAKLILGDNRITATHQLLNKGLFLWKENTAKTDHFLNLGWAEKTAELDKTLPDSFRRSADKRTPFKKSTLENRGVLKLTQPLLSIQEDGAFEHWLNTGVMKLPSTSLRAQSFRNTGDLFVEGSLTGQVNTFESTKKLVSTRKIELTGETLTTREGGEISSQQTVSLKSSTPLMVNGKIQGKRGVTLTAPQIENKGTLIVKTGNLTLNGAFRNEGNLNTDALVYDGLDLINEGTLEANSYDRLGVLRSLSNGRNKTLTIRDGRFIAKKLQNRGQMVLAGGIYQVETTWDNRDGKADVGTLFLTSSSPVLEGSLDVTALLAPSTPYQKLWVKGNTVIRSGAFQTKNLTNTGTLSLGNGRYQADLFEMAEGAKLVTQRGMSMTVKDMTNNGDIVSPTSLKLTSLQGVKKLGRISVEEDLLVELPHWSDAWPFLHKNKDQWAIGRHLKVTAGVFRNGPWRTSLTLPYPVFMTVQDFFITNTLSIKGLTLQSQTFQLGQDNDRLGTLESHGPLTMTVQQDIDCRFGVIKIAGKGTLKSIQGNVFVGGSIDEDIKTIERLFGYRGGFAGIKEEVVTKKRKNGAKVLSARSLTLQGQNVDVSFGMAHGTEALTVEAIEEIINLSGSLSSTGDITLSADLFSNLIGNVYIDESTVIHHKQWPMDCTGFRYQVDYVDDCFHHKEDHTSEPAYVATSNGTIWLFVRQGKNVGSKILAAKNVYYLTDEGYTSDLPPSFEILGSKATHYYKRFGCHHPMGAYGHYRDDTHEDKTIPGIVRAGERVNIQTGLLNLTGNINAPVVRIRGDQLTAQNIGGRRPVIPDSAFEIDLLTFHDKIKSVFPVISEFVQQQNKPSLQANGIVVSDPQTAVVLFSPAPLRSPSGAPSLPPSLPPLALTDEALKFTVMFALSDMLGILNIGGHSGDELLTRLFKKTKQIEKQLHKEGQLVTRDNLQSFHEGMIYTVLEQIGNEMRQVPKLFITPDMVNPHANVSGAITGTQIDLEFQSGVEGNLTAVASSVGRPRDHALRDKKAPLRTLEEEEEKSDESDEEDVPALQPEPSLNVHVDDGSINLTRGHVQSDGPVDLRTERSGDIKATATHIEGKKDVLVDAAGSAGFISTASRTGHGENFAEQANQAALIAKEGKLTIKSKLDTVFVGAKTFSKTGTTIESEGNVLDAALALTSQTVTRDGKNWTRDTYTHQHVSQHVSEGDFQSLAQGVQDMSAPHIKAPSVLVFGGQGVLAREVHHTHEHASHRESKGGGWFGRSKTTDFQSSRASSVGISIEAKKAHFLSGGDLVLTNPNFTVDETVLTAFEGTVKILEGTNYYTSAFTEKGSNLFWQSMTAKTVQSKTHSDPLFTGTLTIEARNAIIQQVCGRALDFMNRLDMKEGKLTIEYVQDLYDVKEQSVSGPTASLSALIALAASMAAVATGGASWAGAAALSTTGTTGLAASIVSAMGYAGFSALCAQSAVALVSHQGHIGKAAQEMAKKDSVLALVKAMAAAGLVAGLSPMVGAPGSATQASERARDGAQRAAEASNLTHPTALQTFTAGLSQHASFQALNAVAVGAIDVAFGQDVERSLKQAATGFAVGLVGSLGANQIGAAYSQGMVDVLTHKVLHAGLGAATGALMGKEQGAVAGAMGAFVAETFADAFSPEKPMEKIKALEAEKGRKLTAQEFTQYYEEELKAYKPTVGRIEDWARLTAATTALLAGQDVTVASMAATNAVQNNFVLLAYYGVMAASLAYSSYTIYTLYEAEGATAALNQLGIEIVINVGGGIAGRAVGLVVFEVAGIAYPTVKAALAAVFNKTPGLRLALGKLVDRLVIAGEKIAQSSLGQAAGKADAALGRMETKIGDKLLGPAGKGQVRVGKEGGITARAQSELDWSIYHPKTKGDAAHHIRVNHGQLKLDKSDQGVFYGDPVTTVKEAWSKAYNQGIKPTLMEKTDVYIIPRPNAGYAGGTGGQRINYDYVTIITKKDTNQVITAFPSGSTPKLPDDYVPFFNGLM